MKKQALCCDFENGYIYRFCKKYNTYNRVGRKEKGYLRFSLDGKWVFVHRYLYERYHKVRLAPDQYINHINFITDDNRLINLEAVDRKQSAQYQRKPKNNTSGFKGVHWHKFSNKWEAKLCTNSRTIYLGHFDNINEAKQAWNAKARELNEQGHMYYIDDD